MNSSNPPQLNPAASVPSDRPDAARVAGRFPWSLLLLFFLFAAVIAVTGRAFLARRQKEARQASHTTLTAIADLKVAQIAAWRNERLSDARFFSQATLVARDVATFLANPDSPESRAGTLDWLRLIHATGRYEVVALFDAQLEERLTTTPWAEPPGPELRELLAAALRTNEAWMTDLQRPDPGSAIHLDLLAPIHPPDSGPGESATPPRAVLLLRIDPRKFLYPLVQSWPTPSRSAETLLIRRDGDDVLFLNELRHRPDTALRLRRPLTEAHLPAALAVRGELGLSEGLDYRGVPVVAAARAVPDTPWFVIAKVDEAELHALLHHEARTAGLMAAALLLAAALGVGLLWRHSRTVSLKLELASQRDRLILAERVALLRRQANDIILLLDDEWRVVEANDRALETYGYSEAELRQMTLRDLGASESQAEFDTHFHRADTSQGLIVEAVHRRKDGSTLPIEISVRSVQVEGRKHHQAIVRDITQRNAQLREIARLNRLYATLSQVNQVIVRARSRDEILQAVCRAAVEFGGFRLAWIGWLDPVTRAVQPAAQAGDADGDVDRLAIVADEVEASHDLTGTALRENRPCVCNDFLNDPRRRPRGPLIEAKGFHSAVAVPLHFGGRVCGALMLYTDESGFFRESELRLAEQVATDVSFALDRQDQAEKTRQAEEALRKNEQRFRALIEQSHDAITLLAADGTILFDSPAITRSLGYSPTERLGRKGFDFVHPDDRAGIADSFAQIVQQPGGVREYQARVLHRDGSTRWIEGVRTNLLDDPAVQAVVVNYRDITERKRVEEALRESEDRYRVLVEEAPDAIGIYQEGKLVFVNATGARLLGARAQTEVLGRKTEEMIHPEDLPAALDRLQRRQAGEAGVYPAEVRYLRLDGTIVPVEVSAAQSTFNGRPAIQFIAHDITRRKRAEAALRASEEKFSKAFHTSPDAITINRLSDGVYVETNQSFAAITGYSEAEVLGKTSFELGLWSDPDDRQRLIQGLQEKGEVINLEASFRLKDGRVATGLMSAALLELNGEPHLLSITRDITGRKQAEEALRESEERLRLAITAANQGLYDLNVQTGEATVSPEYATMLGYDPATFHETNAAWIERLHPDDRERVAGTYRDYLAGKLPVYQVEFRQRTPSGGWKWILSLGKVISRDTVGQPLRMLGTHTDITERKRAEDALHHSEAQLQCILGATADGILAIDRQGKVIKANQRFAQMWRIPQPLLETGDDKTLLQFVLDQLADPEAFLNKVTTLYASEAEDMDTLLFKDGRVFERYSSALRMADSVIGRVWSFRDITERKRVELALRESEELFRSLSASSPVGIFLADFQGQCVYANPRWRAILGLTLRESVGDGWLRMVHPDDREALAAQWSECARQKRECSGEFRVRLPAGMERWVHLHSVVRHADTGEPIDLVGTLEDTTERRRAELELRALSARQQALLAALPEIVTEVDARKVYRWVNQPGREFFGDDVLGKEASSFFEGEQRTYESVESLFGGVEGAVYVESWQRRRDGQIRLLAWWCQPLKNDQGNVTGAISSARDITDQRRAEEAVRESRAQLRALAERLQAVREEERIQLAREVHDQVGQALTSLNLDVAWLNERLARPGLGHARRLLAGRLATMSTLLAETVGTVQRISSELRPGMLDDLGLCAAVEWQAEEFAMRSGLICEAHCGPLSRDPDPQCSTALFRILQELLTNVVRHAQARRVDVELREHAGALVMEVRDDGRGITEEQIRAAKSLGLLGIQERAEAVDGSVEFRSQPGRGTCVTVTVPLS